MTEMRWPWFAAGALLVVAGLAAGFATYLWWLPCRGQILLGSHLVGWPDDGAFTEVCLRRMDEGTAFPGPGYGLTAVPGLLAYAISAVVLTGVAWLILVAALPVRWRLRLPLLLPGALVVVLGLVVATSPEASPRDSVDDTWATTLSLKLMLALVLALIGAVAVLAVVGPRDTWARWAFAVLAVNSFSLVGVVTDYLLMGLWSDANWDAPPGSGYPSAAWLMLCGAAVMIMTALARRPSSGDSAPAARLEAVR